MRRLFLIKQKSARDEKPPDGLSLNTATAAGASSPGSPGPAPSPKVTSPPLSPPGSAPGSPNSSVGSSPRGSAKQLKQDSKFKPPKDVRSTDGAKSPKTSRASLESPRTSVKKGIPPVKIGSPKKSTKKSTVGGDGGSLPKSKLSGAKKSDSDEDEFDVADAEVMSFSSSDDEDEKKDRFDDLGTTVTPSMRISRPGMAMDDDDSNGSEDSDDDVVRRQQPKQNPRGLLAVRGRRGSEASDSGEESNSSLSMNDDDEIENLFDESLAEIQAQEMQAAVETSLNAKEPSNSKMFPIDVLREVPFFQQFSQEHQQQLFAELEEESFHDGDFIVRQGEVGDKFYVIVEGEAVVSKTEDSGETRDLTHIYPGDFFGELVLIYGGQRVATVTSYGRTKCMSLSRKSFEKYDDIRYFLILQKVPLLSGVPKEVQLEIVKRLKPAKFNKDDFVVKQGDRGDAFFMITKGSALVIEDEDKIITRLYEGHAFGEMALLSDEPRIASVKAATELNLMYLSAEDFKELMSADDFSKLLEQESKKIRELRDRRQWKRVNSVSVKPGAATAGMLSPQALNPNSAAKGDPKRLRGASVTQKPAGTQQKLKTGKTSGGAKIINNYILGEQIGKGTFGVVRLCERVDTHEKFAIKIIDKSLFKNKIKSKHQTSLEDMRREAAIMKRLNHENVVNLVDVIDDPKADQLYLVQEYCEKGAIMEKLEGNTPLPEATARKYFRDLLSGIDYLHAHNVIHRDIKPMNLLLTGDQVVKIGDFGAARVLQGDQAVGIAGTPAFMAPELLSQDKHLYNGPAVDLWSCGATLFMLVTGAPPWMAEDEPTLAKKVQNDELVFTGNWGKKLSPHLRNLLTRLLVKDPAQRMTLTQTMEHEWVTEEGADPLPRFEGIQPQLMRVNSALSGLISADETKGAITVLESAETPQTPLLRKTLGKNQSAGPVGSSPRGGPLTGSAVSMTDSVASSGSALTSPRLSKHIRDNLNLGDSVVSVDDEEDESERDGDSFARRVDHADSMDYAMYDVGKKREGESLPMREKSGHHRQGSGGANSFFGKKKMSVVQAFTRRVQSKEIMRNMRGRAGSTASKEGSGSFEDMAGGGGGMGKHTDSSLDVTSTAAEEEDVEMSLSDILNDKGMFMAMQQAKQAPTDAALAPLSPWVPLVKAKRGYHVPHCGIKYGYAEDQGQRPTMEDFVAIVPKLRNPDTFFAAVFDGHNGDMVAKELKSRFHRVLSAQPDFASASLAMAASPTMASASPGGGSVLGLRDPTSGKLSEFADSTGLPVAIRRTCLALDRAMLHFAATELMEMESRTTKGEHQKSLFRTKGGGSKSEAGDIFRKAGSTALVALVRGGSRPKQPCVLTVAWVGDSRAVLCRAGKPIEISKDHKADRDDEKTRIRAAGGIVDRQGRLYGDLAVSRAFGDLQHKGRELKQIVQSGPLAKPGEEDHGSEGTLIAVPDTMQIVLTPQDEFLILASDGLWDVISNEQAVNFVRFHLHRHGDVRKAAVELVDKALDLHSVDNISAVVIGFVGKY